MAERRQMIADDTLMAVMNRVRAGTTTSLDAEFLTSLFACLGVDVREKKNV